MVGENGLLVGVDTGGTFTDVVVCDRTGTIVYVSKVLSTPDDPSAAILAALPRGLLDRLDVVLHGTTTGTNAVLERRGALTALVTTKGFRDVLVLARQDRPDLYDWFRSKPDPLVPRELCFEVDERLAPVTTAQRPLDEEDARAVVDRLAAGGVESVAISLLHAYRDDRHERRLRELVAERLPDVSVSLSSEVLPEIMEYERASTTVANAYLAPVMRRYLERLGAGLRSLGVGAPLYVMQSDGGLGAAASVGRRAVQTVLSGPAAGVIGGLSSTGSSRNANFLTIDMGGTSFDIAYAESRRPHVSRGLSVDGLPLAISALDIHTLGAGGGSIAWVDRGGALRVGPASAGSNPGPACYGRGGEEPTVSDANLVLGRLGAELLDGEIRLDVDAACRAIETRLAVPLGVSVVEAAHGVIDVVNAAMVKGMQLMSLARGRDPRALSIVGFGGAGPLHACELAASLGSREVIIPPLPGNTSAFGLALADLRRERSQTLLTPLAEVRDGEAAAVLDRLAATVSEALREDGAAPEQIALDAVARVSYEGQRYQIEVPVPTIGDWRDGRPFAGTLEGVGEGFRQRHLAAYGYGRSERLTLFSLVVVGTAAIGGGGLTRVRLTDHLGVDRPRTTRPVWFDDRFHETTVLHRRELAGGGRITGPVVIEQLDSTTVVPPEWSGAVDPDGNLVLTR